MYFRIVWTIAVFLTANGLPELSTKPIKRHPTIFGVPKDGNSNNNWETNEASYIYATNLKPARDDGLNGKNNYYKLLNKAASRSLPSYSYSEPRVVSHDTSLDGLSWGSARKRSLMEGGDINFLGTETTWWKSYVPESESRETVMDSSVESSKVDGNGNLPKWDFKSDENGEKSYNVNNNVRINTPIAQDNEARFASSKKKDRKLLDTNYYIHTRSSISVDPQFKSFISIDSQARLNSGKENVEFSNRDADGGGDSQPFTFNQNIFSSTNEKNMEDLPDAQRRLSFGGQKQINERKAYRDKIQWDVDNVHITTVTVGSLMIFFIMVIMVLALRIHCRNREKSDQEWIRHPMVQPSTANSDEIQPNFHHILHPGHLATETIRIKAKGLLERRGSNTSLTIDLGPSLEGSDCSAISPSSKECTAEDYLLSAGNRMNRRQLRQCLKLPRDLHTEFWQIPSNHPERCGVPGAAAKNRYRTVLPNEETRVNLHSAPQDTPETPASQYINANYIRGFDGEDRAYIATQGPLANTVEDFWMMVLQERTPAIVMITRLKEKGRVKCEPYIPNYVASYGAITVTIKRVIQKNGYSIRQLFIKKGDQIHTTLHFWFTTWPDHKAPSSARHLISMATEVEAIRKDCRNPVIVHCSAGIGRTGCFLAVSIAIQHILEEDCIDILGIVCQMRIDRGGMVQTAEQYEFIHRALALYEASLPCKTTGLE